MLTVSETSREDVEKIIKGLNWTAMFWLEKMKAISIEGNLTPKEFNELKDSGIKFIETFIKPVANAYAVKLGEFPVEMKLEKEQKSEPEPEKVGKEVFVSGSETEPRGSLRPAGGPVKRNPVDNPTDAVQVPKQTGTAQNLNDQERQRAFHRKNRKSFKQNNLTLEQRDAITKRWIENNGDMGDLKCTELATELGMESSNQVQGWVSYLDKIKNNPTQESQEDGWEYIISKGKISRMPIPPFFGNVTLSPVFTDKPKMATV